MLKMFFGGVSICILVAEGVSMILAAFLNLAVEGMGFVWKVYGGNKNPQTPVISCFFPEYTPIIANGGIASLPSFAAWLSFKFAIDR